MPSIIESIASKEAEERSAVLFEALKIVFGKFFGSVEFVEMGVLQFCSVEIGT